MNFVDLISYIPFISTQSETHTWNPNTLFYALTLTLMKHSHIYIKLFKNLIVYLNWYYTYLLYHMNQIQKSTSHITNWYDLLVKCVNFQNLTLNLLSYTSWLRENWITKK